MLGLNNYKHWLKLKLFAVAVNLTSFILFNIQALFLAHAILRIEYQWISLLELSNHFLAVLNLH